MNEKEQKLTLAECAIEWIHKFDVNRMDPFVKAGIRIPDMK